jgi:carboxypeptidase family protein
MSTRRLLFCFLPLLPQLLEAQGVTTAAIHGTVTEHDGPEIVGAMVRLINQSNGRRWEIATRSSGRFGLEDVSVGGPYRIEVRAVGFTPQARDGIILALGQRLVADFSLHPAAVTLEPITVIADVDPVLDPGRTGPSETISSEIISGLPNLGRDYLNLTTLSPQTAVHSSLGTPPTGGISIGGQNRLFNSFQIDGGTNQDLYTGRLPGRETLVRPISLEALKEIQVLVSPFDVRHGGFAGGLVNGVTKSGSNEVEGSVFGLVADGALVGESVAGGDAAAFQARHFGGTIGGPVARDRAHYFLSVDVQRSVVPDPGPLVSDTAGGADTLRVGISNASVTRFQNILRNTYSLEPGTLGPVEGEVPVEDIFGKVSVQLGTNSHLEVSHHYLHGDRQGFLPRPFAEYRLSGLDRRDPSTANTSRLIWTSLLGGRWSNGLTVSYLHLRDGCRPTAMFPLVVAQADQGTIRTGTDPRCPSSFGQEALEITENLTVGLGAHVLTLGTHAELLHFTDNLLQNSPGIWRFRSLDLLEMGQAFRYDRALPGPLYSGGVNFRSRQVGAYLQDQWNPSRTLTITVGLRVDVPFLPDPIATNDSLELLLSIDTARLPTGNLLWSPRLGINYDVRGAGRTFLRGGVGLFSGRIPYMWLGNAYRDNGRQVLFLTCAGAQVPPFDPLNQPETCSNGAGPTAQVSFFDPGFKFPQNLKAALGVDHRLPGGIIGTVDLLYTRAVHQLYVSDANLISPTGNAQGEGGRLLFGTMSGTSTTFTATPTRRNAAFGQVARVSNKTGDHAFSFSTQLRKRFGNRLDVAALYAYTRAQDRLSLVHIPTGFNLEGTPLQGTLDDRRLGPSYFEIPHRVQLTATVRLPYHAQLSLLYAAGSGTPFTYVINGDANADGIGSGLIFQDIVYVPRDSTDISLQAPADWAQLDSYIRAEPCLQRQRGRIMGRNSCRNAWFGTLNVRLTKAFTTVAGQSLELTADVYNVLNMIDRDWGQSRVTSPGPAETLLRLVGYDASAGRGVYSLTPPGLRQTQDLASRWQLELGARYTF